MSDRTRAVRKRVLTVLAVVVMLLAFKLFEPGFVWAYGWQVMPRTRYPGVSVPADGWTDVGAKADAWLRDARARLEAPALSAAVTVDGHRVWAGVIGYADLERRLAATPDTAFRIGSTSKAVTSVAMGTLIENREVDLDAPLSTYIPDLSDPLRRATTRQAMSHTAGVRNYSLCLCFPIWENLSRTHFSGSQREVLRPYERDALLFAPGTGFSYTSLGYNVTGAVIESVTGIRFADSLQRRVFQPLGMRVSRVDNGRAADGDAVFYDVKEGEYKAAFRVDNTNKLPSGGILSTPSEMVRLGGEMVEPTLFSRQTRDRLMQPQPLADGRPNPQGYGLGWRYRRDAEFMHATSRTQVLHHHGVAQGSTSHFTIYPDYRMVVSVMMNKAQTTAQPLGEHSARLADIVAAALIARGR